MFLRHIVAFIGIVFFTLLSDITVVDAEDLLHVILGSIFIYTWFLLSSKMTANWWVPLVLLLAVLYMIHMYRTNTKKLSKTTKEYIDIAEYITLIVSTLITFFGFIIYVGEKKIDYRGKFNYETLLMGTATCKNTPNKATYWESLKAAFLVAPGSASASGSGQRGGFISDDSISPVSSFDFVAAE